MALAVEQVAMGDDVALGALLDFAATVGTPRATTPEGYRERIDGVEQATGFLVRDAAGAILAASLGSIMPMIATDQVQVNAFCTPGEHDAFGAALDAIDAWARPLGAITATAHVSDPGDEERAAWSSSTYGEVGRRARMRRTVTAVDADAPSQLPGGVRVVALADHPELEAEADRAWRDGIADIPSALEFTPDDDLTIRRELELDATDPLPPSLVVALDEGGSVVGVAYLVLAPSDPTRGGHRLTAVVPAWRGRGLARGIKVELIRWAARHGVTTLEASNDDRNPAMRAVNERLGYVLDHEIVLYRRAIA